MAAPDKQRPTLNDIPDMDDDLEDLDDVLSQFNPSKGAQPQSPSGLTSPPPPPPTATTTTSFHRPRTNTRVDAAPISVPGSGRPGLDIASEADEDELSAEFSRELAKGMESLMREISSGATAGGSAGGSGAEGPLDDKEAERAFKAAWEAMLVEGMDGMGHDLAGLEDFLSGDKASDTRGTGLQQELPTVEPNAFQDKIKQAMDKLKESESNLQADSSKSDTNPLAGTDPESLQALLASLGDLGLGEGDGPESEAELAGLLENMMGQLMSKDVLYEPLKELSDSFPQYLAHPPAPLSTADRARYESQLKCVGKILAVFDDPKYNDHDISMAKSITDLMNEMQTYGSPPSEIMGPLPPGLSLGADGMPQMPDGCVVV